MADLNTVNNTLNQILDALKNPSLSKGAKTEEEKKGEEKKKKEQEEKKKKAEKDKRNREFVSGIDSFSSATASMSSGVKGATNGIIGLISKLGPWGAAIASTTKLGLALGEMFGKLADSIGSYHTTMREAQIKMNDLTSEHYRKFTEMNFKMQGESVKYQTDLQIKMLDTQGEILMNAAKLMSEQFIKSAEISIGSLVDGINESAYRAAEAKISMQAEAKKNVNIQQKLEGIYGRFASVRTNEYNYLKEGTAAEAATYNANLAQQIKETELLARVAQNEHWVTNEANANEPEYIIGLQRNKQAFEEYQSQVRSHPKQLEYGALTEKQKNDGNESVLGKSVDTEGYDKKIERDLHLTQNWDNFRQEIVTLNKLQFQGLINGTKENESLIKNMNAFKLTTQQQSNALLDKQAELKTNISNLGVDIEKAVSINWLKFAESNEKWIQEFDKVTNNLGLSMGYTNKNQMAEFQKGMFQMASVASEFGKTYEDFAKVQHAFIESTGRNRGFNQSDARSAMALGYILGDDGLAANYASEMEIFNTGVADSVDLLGEALDDVNKMGLNSRKYTKTLVDNLKLAQKYNFKGGTKGLMEMAKWAQNTRFNMSSLSSMLDKISEGGLEGVITQGAQFQVLGGHSAMNADPLAMLYERYADPAALAKRFQDMTKGYGHLDTVTGETSFSGNELMLIEQIAKTQGRSVEDVQNEIRQRNKVGVVAKQLRGDFDSDAQALISNAATYDRKTGQFKVNVKNADGTYSSRDVSELTKEDIDRLMPEEHNARMEEWVSEIVSNTAKLAGAAEKGRATVAEATWDDVHENFKQRMETFDNDIYKHIDEYIAKAKEYTNQITESYGEYTLAFQTASEKANEFEPTIEGIEKMAKSIENVLGETATIIANANTEIAKASIKSNETVKYEYKDYNNNLKVLDYTLPTEKDTTNVTPIHDGLVLPDSKDVGIFAKEGGPIGNFLNDLYTDVKSLMGGEGGKFNVEISGKLDLSSGGKSVDIISEIQTNPILLRALSQMLAEHMSSAINGGRGKHPLAYGSV